MARLVVRNDFGLTHSKSHKGFPHHELNNEEFDRKMAFIVEQQAQFASDIQLLQESQGQLQEVRQMGDVVTCLANVTHAGFTEVNAKINAQVEVQIRTEESVTRTDANLRDFIAVVDRRFSDGKNGK
jgi:hypothetical protein